MSIKFKYENGFSLIELMVTIAIVGVLAGIAYPSYQNSIIKGKRAEGRTALIELMQQQERHMTQTNSYCAFSNDEGTTEAVVGCSDVPFKTFSGDNAAKTAYQLSASACPPASTVTALEMRECVEISAVPTGADTEAGTLQISSTGLKTCTGSKPEVCW